LPNRISSTQYKCPFPWPIPFGAARMTRSRPGGSRHSIYSAYFLSFQPDSQSSARSRSKPSTTSRCFAASICSASLHEQI
jgi:hypothetical protein